MPVRKPNRDHTIQLEDAVNSDERDYDEAASQLLMADGHEDEGPSGDHLPDCEMFTDYDGSAGAAAAVSGASPVSASARPATRTASAASTSSAITRRGMAAGSIAASTRCLAPALSRSTWSGPAAATARETRCPCGTSCISRRTASPLPVAARRPRGRASHSGRMALAATTGAPGRPETTVSTWTNGATGSSSTLMPPEGSATRGSGGSRSEHPGGAPCTKGARIAAITGQRE